MQETIQQLKKVKTGATAYKEAQELLKFAQAKVQEATQ